MTHFPGPSKRDTYIKEAERISAYFKDMRIKLKDLKPYHIEGFYKSLYEKGLSGNTVLHFHILIRECLQYAFKNDFVIVNVANQRKKKIKQTKLIRQKNLKRKLQS